MKKLIITLVAVTFLLLSCKKQSQTDNTNDKIEKKATTFSEKVEVAHNKDAFLANEAIKFDVLIEFGGNEILDATISVATTSEYAIIEKKDGSKIYINKDKVFVSPELKDDPSVRFHAYTWSYFFLFPYKLNDQGTIWKDTYKTNEAVANFDTAKLTFKANVGDSSDDWYIVYKNKETDVLDNVAYIVTAGKTNEEAEKDPHAIKYEDYKLINNIPISNNWSFWGWNSTDGLTNKIGSAKITNIEFIDGFKETVNAIPADFISK